MFRLARVLRGLWGLIVRSGAEPTAGATAAALPPPPEALPVVTSLGTAPKTPETPRTHDFYLAARLHSVAKLNVRKDRPRAKNRLHAAHGGTPRPLRQDERAKRVASVVVWREERVRRHDAPAPSAPSGKIIRLETSARTVATRRTRLAQAA